ncbi:MAG: META domain-containing protein [Anaerolineales bacterium]
MDGTSWVLFVFLNSQPIEGFQPTILFKNGQVSGNAGCNHYGGSYTVDGDRIEFGTIGGTEMYCMEPEGIMDREMAYERTPGKPTTSVVG